MQNILNKIIEDKKISLKLIKNKISLNKIEDKIKSLNFFF